MFAYEYFRIYQHMSERTNRPHSSAITAWALLWSCTVFVTAAALMSDKTFFALLGHDQKGAVAGISAVLMGSMLVTCFAFFSGDDRVPVMARRFASETPEKQRMRSTVFKLHLAYVPTVFILGPWLARHIGR